MIPARSVPAESDRPEARVRLVSLLERGGQGQYAKPDILIREKAKRAIEAIDERLATYEFIKTLFFGLSLGSVLLLITIGLAITILIFAFTVFVALLLILKKTWLDLSIRAVSRNRAMANAMGIGSEWVDALTFGLGTGVAGIAGVALSQLTNVGPNMGQAYIIDSFMVVVFSGVGNLWGTFVGAMSPGVVSKFLEPWAGAVLAKIMVLVFIIFFIQKRPRGLFPQKGRATEG
uniref:Branched-chain amino acid transport system / permease component n=1 Tax=Candidatus Kentrum sp. FW TaxID=2126338 RepID=A0A450TX33_9GAMM|nr:MAG: Branched-chain amino acid transport system / permease component [Candidatus Kentron sp. FW]